MSASTKVALAIFGIAGAILLSFIGLVAYVSGPTRTIAKDVQITGEWRDFPIAPPIKALYRDQTIMLGIKDYDWSSEGNSFTAPLKLPDGTIVDPQIQLVDSLGNSYPFHHSGAVRTGGLLGSTDEPVFRAGSSDNSPDLPRDKEFTKLRIRSDVSFRCSRIEWVDYNPK